MVYTVCYGKASLDLTSFPRSFQKVHLTKGAGQTFTFLCLRANHKFITQLSVNFCLAGKNLVGRGRGWGGRYDYGAKIIILNSLRLSWIQTFPWFRFSLLMIGGPIFRTSFACCWLAGQYSVQVFLAADWLAIGQYSVHVFLAADWLVNISYKFSRAADWLVNIAWIFPCSWLVSQYSVQVFLAADWLVGMPYKFPLLMIG